MVCIFLCVFFVCGYISRVQHIWEFDFCCGNYAVVLFLYVYHFDGSTGKPIFFTGISLCVWICCKKSGEETFKKREKTEEKCLNWLTFFEAVSKIQYSVKNFRL